MPGIRARVLEDAQPQRLRPVPSRLPPILNVDPLRAAVVHRDQVLAARLGPAHRPAGLARQPGDEHVLDVQPLAAEAAADVGGDDARSGPGSSAEDRRQAVAVLVRGLRREPHRQPAVVLDLGRRRARLDRAGREPLARRSLPSGHLAAAEQVLVGGRGRPLEAHVRAGVLEQHDLVFERLARVGDDRQRLVVDLDQLGRVDAAPAARSEDDGDDLAGPAHLLAGEERPVPALVKAEERQRRLLAAARCPVR